MEKLKELTIIILLCLITMLFVVMAMCELTKPVETEHVSINRKRPALDFTNSERPGFTNGFRFANEVLKEHPIPRTDNEIEEPEHEWLSVMATAYTDAEEENGGFGAHDCKYGFDLVDGEHIASDLSFLPYGTKVYIEGLGERTVVDTASSQTIKRVNAMARERDCEGWIDVFMGGRTQDMDDWGIKVVRLYVIEDN